MRSNTRFLYDPYFLNHDTGEDHPESPARLSAVLEYLSMLDPTAKEVQLQPRPDLGELDSPDVAISLKSFNVALRAVEGALTLADAMMSGDIQMGRGKDRTLNCPMRKGAEDEHYKEAFMEKILPAANAFKPDAVLISAGFDAHRLDPLAQINLSETIFAWMTQRMMEIADKHAHGRLISLLEGGYNLHALPRCIEQHLNAL
jgi:acetoin utilization deacetylase AcuC-like enzyme